MFKPVGYNELMPDYHPDGRMANELFVIIWKLDIIKRSHACRLMLDQLAYWGIQA